MEHYRVIIAVILSTLIIVAGFAVQNLLQRRNQPDVSRSGDTVEEVRDRRRSDVGVGPDVGILPYGEDPAQPRERTYANNTLRVVFSPMGGSITSFELREHRDGDDPVNMIFRGASERQAFDIQFGALGAEPLSTLFYFHPSNDPNVIEFRRQFYVVGSEDAPFTLRKVYHFYPGEYLFELEIHLENSINDYIPLDFEGYAYTLWFGPQIGPVFRVLDNRNEYRRYYRFADGRRRTVNLNRADASVIEDRVEWVAIVGKYFTAIAAPGAGDYRVTVADSAIEGLPAASHISIARPTIRSSINVDTYRFYLGPKVRSVLTRYNDSEANLLGTRNLELEKALDNRPLLGWLENVLKWLLQIFYRIVPNYGVAIILLTILVKAALWPLTHKSYESTSRMQTLSPKIQQIRERHSKDSSRMNQEMAALYKREKVNPAGGCLPMLLQFPFFIAMFGLFNNHFDLRGAIFIPGWIDDLSAPESIWNFGRFTLPLLNWNDLRLLPIIFVLTQLISSRLTQTPSANSGQAKMMAYILPIVFFFILYNMPSGLLVYWIVTNVLTAAQQYYNSNIKGRISKKAV